MGHEFTGKCNCGLEKQVYIGSSRNDHGKKFDYPHFCNACNSLITVNILNEKTTCSHCGSNDVHSYAALTTTLPFDSEFNSRSDEQLARLGVHKSDLVAEKTYFPDLDKDLVLFKSKNFCPACKQNSLEFTISADYD
jgi:DNA-directed RNA polymerase subunit M/transcription elongation factor TFIIS